MTVLGVLLARLDSQRLPGKALLDVDGRPLVSLVLARARRSRGLDHLVLATSERSVDDPLVDWARAEALPVYRGSAENVVDRVLGAASRAAADYIVRINGDSPFLDPELLDDAMAEHLPSRPHLITNLEGRTFPYGISVEVAEVEAIRGLAPTMTESDKEHVTQALYGRPELRVAQVRCDLEDAASIRAVVDTAEDLERLCAVREILGAEADVAGFRAVADAYRGLERS